MSGIPFRVDGKGKILISWMSRNKAYWSISDEKATRFARRIGTPSSGAQGEAYPIVLVNKNREVLFIWKQGKQVNWARFQLDGTFTGEQGTAGQLSNRNKPTAFVGADENFYIVF